MRDPGAVPREKLNSACGQSLTMESRTVQAVRLEQRRVAGATICTVRGVSMTGAGFAVSLPMSYTMKRLTYADALVCNFMEATSVT